MSSALKGNLSHRLFFFFFLPSTTWYLRLIFLSCYRHLSQLNLSLSPLSSVIFLSLTSGLSLDILTIPTVFSASGLGSAVSTGSTSVADLAWVINSSRITDSLPISGPVSLSLALSQSLPLSGSLIVPLNLTVFLLRVSHPWRNTYICLR